MASRHKKPDLPEDNSLKTMSDSSLIAMKVTLSDSYPIPEEYKTRWASIMKAAAFDADMLIFAAELLSILQSPDVARFESKFYSEYGMGCAQKWSITAGKARMTRHLEQTVNESWQSFDVDIDRFNISGLSGSCYIDWDGGRYGSLIMEIGNISPSTAEKILSLAWELFKKVQYEIKTPSPPAKLRAE